MGNPTTLNHLLINGGLLTRRTVGSSDLLGLSGDTSSRARVVSEIQEACIHKKYSHESFELGPDVNVASNSSLSGPNVWPSRDVIPGFQEPLSQEVVGLGMKLLSAFALALNLPEDYFADKVQTTPATMRLTYYPPQAQAIDNEAPGLGEHTEYVFFESKEVNRALIYPQLSALYYPMARRKSWTPSIEPIRSMDRRCASFRHPCYQVSRPGLLWWMIVDHPCCSVADQLSRWTIHRVINNFEVRRYSIPLFFGLDHDVMLEALPSCVSASRPARHEPIRAGDHVRARFEKVHAKAESNKA
ncbi:hypothetical protein AG1IA_09288 [Rhizoctonia solani AG-1 IA]|uniref:Uncharacterized protein n=1 Tax=Thanatephorus cucumeris (strain AG1-IA) TaxID=983506 RepID=L8WIV4_THACA|nr:hypothetical protein AG1IA_09288 [Rhizoctonia solani AG-1 IA]